MTENTAPSTPRMLEKSRPPKPKPSHPIESALRIWHSSLPPELLSSITSTISNAINSAPKRWVVYPPMALLPSGSFSHDWWAHLKVPIPTAYKNELWREVLLEIGKKGGKGILTHLAINAGIPLKNLQDEPIASNTYDQSTENVLRTPTGLIMLYGDFGPVLSPSHVITEKDFNEGFWVSTKQNGIMQVWAPRYTMFSRGNVKEKARLLGFHGCDSTFESRRFGNEETERGIAVDLYAGIGYFVFSYVKLGVGRVVGWELNPWSVEGLRRGARANGWDVRIVKAEEEVSELEDSKIVVFQEDNRRALERLKGMERFDMGSVRHVNCGLLPSSEGSWRTGFALLKGNGWLHLHENVGTRDLPRRKDEIEKIFTQWQDEVEDERHVQVEHVELVKTFAPDVWHCVFDLYISFNKT